MIEYVKDLEDKRLRIYSSLTESQLRNSLNPAEGLIIVESPKVIRTALSQGFSPVSLLCERKHIEGDAKEIIESLPEEIPVFTSDRETLGALTGYKLTRGVLCGMHRPEERDADKILKNSERICVIDGVCDTTNIGAIFRSAAALDMDAVVLTPTACDPYNRRSIRVSMGTVFLIDWCRIDSIESLKGYGFKTVAMALRDDSIDISSPLLRSEPKLAIILGTEGDGLSPETIESSDFVVRIPMANGVDSLNVAAASAIAFWELGKRS